MAAETAAVETRGRASRNWLGRKDSNLQPSDPESAALPLRHSPTGFGSAAYSNQRPNGRPVLASGCPHALPSLPSVAYPRMGRLLMAGLQATAPQLASPWHHLSPSATAPTCGPKPRSSTGRQTSTGLFAALAGARTATDAWRPRAHSDRQRRRRSHQPLKGRLEQNLRAVEVERPTNSENAIAEQPVGLGVPVRAPDPLQCRRPEVIRDEAENPPLPSPFFLRLGQLGGDRRHHERNCRQPDRPSEPVQTAHT